MQIYRRVGEGNVFSECDPSRPNLYIDQHKITNQKLQPTVSSTLKSEHIL